MTAEKHSQKILLIANPQAGSKSLGYNWNRRIYPIIKDTLKNFDFEFTTSKDHATDLTREANRNGYDIVVAMGGDGTINEVVNGFFENGVQISKKTSLGILPFGSGGDFIRTAGIERDFRKAVLRLNSKNTKKIDIGKIQFLNNRHATRYFINTAQIGLGYHIMKRVNMKPKFIPALIRYVSGSFQGYLDSQNIPVTLRLDDKQNMSIHLTNLIIANGKFFGRGMKPAPEAELDDGFFDLVIIKNMKLSTFCTNFHKLYFSRKNISKNLVEFTRAKSIQINRQNQSDFLGIEADGEPCGEGDQTLSLLPQALSLII